MKNLYKIFAVIAMLATTACHNKDLCPDCEHENGVLIDFDWSNVSEAPEGMSVYFYNTLGELAYNFNLPAEGGLVRILNGHYTIICVNNDSEYIQYKNSQTMSELVGFVREGEITEEHTRISDENGEVTISNAGSEKVYVMPDKLLRDIKSDYEVKSSRYEYQTVLLTPADELSYYTIDLRDIVNPEYVNQIRLSLSGISSNYHPHDPTNQNESAIIPTNGYLNSTSKNIAEGKMQTFGHILDQSVKKTLTIHIWGKGGNMTQSFDVSDIIHNAENPKKIHISINSTIVVPEPIGNGDDGFNTSIDDWYNVDETILL